MDQLKPAVVFLVLLTLLTGVAYPLVVTGIAQVVFPGQANGSLIVKDGKPVGSDLIGQPFDDPKYFWGRLSATAPSPSTARHDEPLIRTRQRADSEPPSRAGRPTRARSRTELTTAR
jgi:K+-transporting ATPase KdpC subunit